MVCSQISHTNVRCWRNEGDIDDIANYAADEDNNDDNDDDDGVNYHCSHNDIDNKNKNNDNNKLQ